eukprot:1148379-Pelagomonas_calceolata.AAC.4
MDFRLTGTTRAAGWMCTVSRCTVIAAGMTFIELGLDTHTATDLALKLHAHSVQRAYKLASTDELSKLLRLSVQYFITLSALRGRQLSHARSIAGFEVGSWPVIGKRCRFR